MVLEAPFHVKIFNLLLIVDYSRKAAVRCLLVTADSRKAAGGAAAGEERSTYNWDKQTGRFFYYFKKVRPLKKSLIRDCLSR